MVAINPNNRILDLVAPEGTRSSPFGDATLQVAARNASGSHAERGHPGQPEAGHGAGLARRGGQGTGRGFTARPPLTAEDIRIHVWLSERLAVLHYERHGLWPKLRRFLFGNRLVRFLARLPHAKT
jgi:hypothetical protein